MRHLRKHTLTGKQIRHRVTALVFLVLLLGLAVANAVWPKESFSENENRVLEPFPTFSMENLLSGSFTENFDTYISDHFALRNVWVQAKTFAEIALLKQDSGGAYFAKDGYLMERFDKLDRDRETGETIYAQNLRYIKTFADNMKAKHNIDVHTMLVPTANYVLSEKLPAFAPEISQKELIEQAKEAVPNFVDLSSVLLAHKNEYIYYRNDHHWTNLGVCYAYEAWCRMVGLTPHGPEWYRTEVLSDEFYGTTYSKAKLYTVEPDTMTAYYAPEEPTVQVDYNLGKRVTDTLYERSHLDTKDKYSVFLDGNQPIVKITTSNKNGRKLLLIKDSYANSFATFAANDYEELYLVDLRHYRAQLSKLVEESGVNEILVLYNLSGFSSDRNLFSITR